MNYKQEGLLLGAHLSISEGFAHMIAHAEKLGCTAIQFFSKSNRQWHAHPLTEDEIDAFQQALTHSSIRSTIIHASYLINLGSPEKNIHTQAALALKDELVRAQHLNVDALVFHPGSRKTGDEKECLTQIAHHLNDILNATEPTKTKLLIETMAGQGTSIGHSFEQLATIYELIIQKDRVGICLDTCHIFAAGYDITNQGGYEQTMRSFENILGLEQLGVIHINDSKKPLGSRVDRHEHIGQGYIGLNAFAYIINDKRLEHIPKILETPKETPLDDIRNLETMKNLWKV